MGVVEEVLSPTTSTRPSATVAVAVAGNERNFTIGATVVQESVAGL